MPQIPNVQTTLPAGKYSPNSKETVFLTKLPNSPKGSPVCQVTGGQGVCMKQKHEDPTTTSDPPKPTSSKVTKADVIITSKALETTLTSETTTPRTSMTQTSSADQTSTTPPPQAIPTVATDSGVPTLLPVGNPSTTSAAPTPSATGITNDLSTSTKITSGAVAGSIVALAFGSLIIYTIVKKRKESALARAEEESKAAPMSAPITAAPMGSGGKGRPLSIQPEPEMLQMVPQAPAAVFASGPQHGRSLREGIPPPSPPPNAMVVGTPPYRRDQYAPQPSTPTSLRAGVPGPQLAQQWNPAEGYHGEAYPVEGGYPAQQGYDQNYPPNFPFPEETYDAGYHGTGQAYSLPAGSYQAYSPPSTPRYPPGTAHSPH
ncbi:hypothetical protein EV426DRAFT_35016 [Tirmania nivea]|nr:hypothetical protein EV426DRAFT_35016 [Tirmania nivea]